MFRMPHCFGPTASPRFTPPGAVYEPTRRPSRRVAYARFHTDAAALQKYLPAGFSLRGEPLIALEHTLLSRIDWLAGRSYSMLTVRFPVDYDCNGTPLSGWFQPVIWENMADPIISGREELGFAKIYADLPPEMVYGDEHVFRAEWDGFKFFSMRISDVSETETARSPSTHLFHHRYIPKPGAWGEGEADYVVVTPAGNTPMRVLSHRSAQGAVEWGNPSWQDMPTQFQIVQALREIPLLQLHSAGILEAEGGKDMSDQCRPEALLHMP